MASDLPKLSELRDRAEWSTFTGDQAALVAALDAVLELHPRVEVCTSASTSGASSCHAQCQNCQWGEFARWPCRTIRTLSEHIDLEGWGRG